jgi:CRP-like cAMP-binding protein
MALETEVEVLKAIPMFRGIDPRRLKLIAFISQRLSFREGDTVFEQGDASDSACILLEGTIDVVLQTAAGPLTVSQIGPRMLFGEMGAITGSTRSATLLARSDLAVLRLPKEHFISLLEEFPQLALAVIRDLAHRLEAMNRLLTSRAEAGRK